MIIFKSWFSWGHVAQAARRLAIGPMHSGSKRKSSWKKLITFFLSKIFSRKFVQELHVTYMFIVESLNTLIVEELPLYRGSSTYDIFSLTS